jgi:hypothetical protein
MRKKMIIQLVVGIIGLLAGFLMIRISAIPQIVGVLVSAVSGAWIGIVIATKGGISIRDEMVVRIEHMSGYYTFHATLYFIFLLVGLDYFSLMPFGVSDLFLTLMLFMCITFIITKYVLMRRGKAE